ncbi:TolC family protein [Cyclobacterium amurskyense]|uniref:Outer membrane efflux protein n=1 Tax=Cyclobacterium amurskyense TaxID=320787 RepID=A0A0H4P9Z4_9BACT|nr:TolC family protein [Cyclobacterium amurskyense]AKP51296.1 Outer membrane efflux protein [Cyclobacterium amurskyense]
MKGILIFILAMVPLLVPAQQVLTLEECLTLAETNYPLARQKVLLEQQFQSEVNVLELQKLPKLDLNAQSTYQSDVTRIPIELPNADIQPPNKDQYRATLDVNQLIYNGGSIAANARLKQAELKTRQQEVEVTIYQVKERVNGTYFKVLLLQEQEKLLDSKMKILQERAKEAVSAIRNGMALPSSNQLLQAELLLLEQQKVHLKYERKKALESLSSLTFKDIALSDTLLKPEILLASNTPLNRPELKLFEYKAQQLDISKELIDKEKSPSVMGFAQAGYGNPGLNMLDNSFQEFYMVGLKFNWRLFDWGKNQEKKLGVEALKQVVATEKETFVLNNEIQLQEAWEDISKYREILEQDAAIVNLREEVIASNTSQFQNGTITSSAYIIDLNKLYDAKINQKLTEIQLVMSQAKYKLIKGDF